MNIPGYDAWKLAGPDDEHDELGTEEGQPCNRIHEPDEDAPRGYKPKPCKGVMGVNPVWDQIQCNTCNEFGD